MRHKRTSTRLNRAVNPLAMAAFVLIATLLIGVFIVGTKAQSLRNIPEAKFTEGGPEACLTCHGGPKMTVMADTPHGEADNPHAPYGQKACETCHGAGSFHVSSARGGKGFPLLNNFEYVGKPAQGQFDTCLGCHAKTSGDRIGIGWTSSVHDANGLSCSSCHEAHAVQDPVLNVSKQQNLCAGCHGLSNSKHNGFEKRGIRINKLKCSTCHDPHDM